MRWMSAIIAVGILIVSLNVASAFGDGTSGLMEIVSSNEDTWIDSKDLAFFLATHGFDAVPKDGYVEVHIEDLTFKLVPNGKKPGLCDIVS